jgi:hypothetical protein
MMTDPVEAPMKRWKIVTITGLAMIAIGFALSVGYDLYCIHVSGQQLGKFPVAESSAALRRVTDGRKQSFPGPAAKPISIDLDPSMNPVLFNWSGYVSSLKVTSQDYNEYRSSLFFAGRPAMQASVRVWGNDHPNERSRAQHSIGWFNVTQAGRYDLMVAETHHEVKVTGIEVEVRRNVLVPSKPIVLTGWLLLVVGFGFVFAIPVRMSLAAADKQKVRRYVTLAGIGLGLGLALLGALFYLGN